jgi:hypothetical protein
MSLGYRSLDLDPDPTWTYLWPLEKNVVPNRKYGTGGISFNFIELTF